MKRPVLFTSVAGWGAHYCEGLSTVPSRQLDNEVASQKQTANRRTFTATVTAGACAVTNPPAGRTNQPCDSLDARTCCGRFHEPESKQCVQTEPQAQEVLHCWQGCQETPRCDGKHSPRWWIRCRNIRTLLPSGCRVVPSRDMTCHYGHADPTVLTPQRACSAPCPTITAGNRNRTRVSGM